MATQIKINFGGYVYCAKKEDGNIIVRRDGKVVFSTEQDFVDRVSLLHDCFAKTENVAMEDRIDFSNEFTMDRKKEIKHNKLVIEQGKENQLKVDDYIKKNSEKE
jgi:hypothetical protein